MRKFNVGDKVLCLKYELSEMVILPCTHCEFKQVEKFAETERGNGGFGSTGR